MARKPVGGGPLALASSAARVGAGNGDDTARTRLLATAARKTCRECPAERLNVFDSLVREGRDSCQLVTASVEARASFQPRWAVEFAYALVRQGVVVRECIDTRGSASAIDAAGAGCLIPLSATVDSMTRMAYAAFAAGPATVCLLPYDTIERLVASGGGPVQELLDLQTQAMRRVELLTHVRSLRDALRAVGALLLALSDTLTPPARTDLIPAGLQQRDLAHLLSIRHETVCRSIGHLEAQGIVERASAGIRILDRARLEQTTS
jgi:CRP-like cAMP-binding protein